MALKTVTDASFDKDVLNSPKAVLVNFRAEWSDPCRQIAPTLEAIAAEHGDTIEIVTLDIDHNPATAAEYGVTSIPTMNVYQNGKVVRTIIGAKPRSALERELDSFLSA
ncbi:thioredoxin [Streptomyces peucetius]|nr:thioredoxin [Streptomyces peucetius subsp. caesius ATCC 27952]